MLYSIVWGTFVVVCIFLIVIVLAQRGRGGGLIESLAGADSLFGTKTSSFLVNTTTVLAVLFFVLSTLLAYLSKERGRSITAKMKIEQPVMNVTKSVNVTEAAAATPAAEPVAAVNAVGTEEAAPVAAPVTETPVVPADAAASVPSAK